MSTLKDYFNSTTVDENPQHLLRNFVFQYCVVAAKDIPIGKQASVCFFTAYNLVEFLKKAYAKNEDVTTYYSLLCDNMQAIWKERIDFYEAIDQT